MSACLSVCLSCLYVLLLLCDILQIALLSDKNKANVIVCLSVRSSGLAVCLFTLFVCFFVCLFVCLLGLFVCLFDRRLVGWLVG